MTGTLPIAHGGTGATTALGATQNLGVFSNKIGGTEIPANADLNTYTTPGTYYSPDSTRTKTLTNRPFDVSGFKLFVDGSYGTNYVHQYVIHSTSAIWHRSKTGSTTWSAWAKIYDTVNKPSKSDIGLGNVDNTADANKSVASAATLTATHLVELERQPHLMQFMLLAAYRLKRSEQRYLPILI